MNRLKALTPLVTVSLMAALAAVYTLKIRPWMLHWGTTVDEQTRLLPGDDCIPNPTHVTTHAITIEARPEEIWPWLAQMGQNQAGFYTHNWIERLLRSGIPDVHEIHPEWQHLEVGDLVRTNREVQPGHPLGWEVVMVERNHTLVLKSKSLPIGTYDFILMPVAGKTRLLVRDRAVWRWWESPFRLLIFEPLHAYMETGVLQGIKQRAERAHTSVPACATEPGNQ